LTLINNQGSGGCAIGTASVSPPAGNGVRVSTSCTDFLNKPFIIFVY